MKSHTRNFKKEKKSDIKTQKSLLSIASEFEQDKDVWEHLLTPFKVIRDAVHGDIWVTEFEARIIDTEIFQRLRHIRQLGPTYLVYPDAHHTRFEHCLGTLYMAQKIIDSVQRNYRNRALISKNFPKLAENALHIFPLNTRDIVIIRMATLIHDAAHLPFGHLLEKEGNVLRLTQWADSQRLEYFFEKCSMRELMESHLRNVVGEVEAKNFVEELKKVLRAIEGADPDTGKFIENEFPEDVAVGKLNHPYRGDIIGNTICADLLDYVLRDSYFSGLRLSEEVRLINSFAVIGKSKREARLTLLLVRKGRLRLDTLSEAVEFLRQRYFLAERVYYHRVKTSASAMIIDAIYACLRQIKDKHEKIKFLMEYGDDVLLHVLCSLDTSTMIHFEEHDANLMRKIIGSFNRRSLYKPVYAVHSRTEGRESTEIKRIIERFADPEERYGFQEYIESLLGLEPGSITIYVTKKDLGKAARTRCLWIDGEVKPLEDIGKERTLLREELETLRQKYEQLWTLYVFMDREIIDQWGEYVAGFCKHYLIEINDVEDEELSKAKPLEEWEIFLKVGVPEDVAISKEQRDKFKKEVMALKARNDAYRKLGLPREELTKVFSSMISK